MYFNRFQKIFYQFEIKGQKQLIPVKDITTNIRFRKQVLDSITLYELYDIKEGETPEILADRIYGSPKYHWVIMLFNDRYNIMTDWPLPYHTFEEMVREKYAVYNPNGTVNVDATNANIYATHHWEKDNLVVMPNTYQAVAITNYEHETRLNDGKRRIKLVNPGLLTRILTQYKELV